MMKPLSLYNFKKLISSLSCFHSVSVINNLILQADCYHYLFDAAIKLRQLGID